MIGSPPCPACGGSCHMLFTSCCGLGLSKSLAPIADEAAAHVLGTPVPEARAIQELSLKLRQARNPMIVILDGVGIESARSIVALADTLRGSLDLFRASASPPIFDVGEMGSTLAEIRERADTLIIWPGSKEPDLGPLLSFLNDPRPASDSETSAHPKRIAWVGNQASSVPEFVTDQLEAPEDPIAGVWYLRLRMRTAGMAPGDSHVAGLDANAWERWDACLRSTRQGVFFLGESIDSFGRVREACQALCTDLNSERRFSVLPLPRSGSPASVSQVMLWQSGYSTAVGFQSGFPRSYGREFSWKRALQRREHDFWLVIGADRDDEWDERLRDKYSNLPYAVIAPQNSRLTQNSQISLISPFDDLQTFVRFDGLTVPVRTSISSSFTRLSQVLSRLLQELRLME